MFNQPTKIKEREYQLDLSYGANQQRNKAVLKKNGNTINTRYYINKYYEKEIDSMGGQWRYHYIYGPTGVVALYIDTASTVAIDTVIGIGDIKDRSGTSIAGMYYIHTDHLGSYIAITDANKNVVQRNYFDAWGNVTAPNDTLMNFPVTNRGFTGHEHYPYFRIINMNGRLYDPVIGRFFSPDKYVANSSFTQDFNRYSYARNNPLMYTDPDGEIAWFVPLIAAVAIPAIKYTAQVAMSPGGFQNWNWDDFGFNMMMSVASSLMSAGIGGAVGTIGGMGIGRELARAGAHGVAQGVFYSAGGGTFWQGAAIGFSSSIVGSAMSGAPAFAQIGVSALSGGATSKMMGGSFLEGAATATIIATFNHLLHPNDLPDVNRKRMSEGNKFLWNEGMPTVKVIDGEVYVVPKNSNYYVKLKNKDFWSQLENIYDKKFGAGSRFFLGSLELSMAPPFVMEIFDVLIRTSTVPPPLFFIPMYDPTIGSRTEQNNLNKLINVYRREEIIR